MQRWKTRFEYERYEGLFDRRLLATPPTTTTTQQAGGGDNNDDMPRHTHAAAHTRNDARNGSRFDW